MISQSTKQVVDEILGVETLYMSEGEIIINLLIAVLMEIKRPKP